MKSRRLICVAATTLALIGLSLPLAAQENHASHHRYKLVDLGTLGGPDSTIFGITGPLNNRGMVSSCATTSVPDPGFPNINPYFTAPGDSYIQHAFLWQDGDLSDLGTLPGGTSSCEQWISDTGLIVGGSTNGLIDSESGFPAVHATLWLGRKPFDLGTLGGNESIAFAVNNFGQVAGGASNKIADSNSSFFFPGATQMHAVFWRDGVIQDLHTLGEGTDSMAYNVNEVGQVAGMSFTNNTINSTTGLPTVDVFLWEKGKMHDLGTLGGVLSLLSELNNRGQVAGYSNLSGDLTHHPFIGDRTGLKDLGTFGGDNGVANWLNDEGQVVGTADFPGDVIHHAFVWKDGVMTDLGTVDGDGCSNGVGINSLGEMVGTSTNCHGSVLHLFLWERGSMLNLSSLILPGSDVIFNDPTFINDRGEIAGDGVLPNGDLHAVLLIPCDRNHFDVDACDNNLADTNTVALPRTLQAAQSPAPESGNHGRVLRERPDGHLIHGRRFSDVRAPNN
jgi:probable HAF family extracellular repeat protein